MAYVSKNDLVQSITEVNASICEQFHTDYLYRKFGQKKIVYLKYDELVELLNDINVAFDNYKQNNIKKEFASTEEGLAIANKAQELYNQYYEKCESFISTLQNKAESSVKQLMGNDFKLSRFNSNNCTIQLVDKNQKDVFGADIDFCLEEKHGENFEVVEVEFVANMGSIGSFNMTSNYAHFLASVGKFFNNSPVSKKTRKEVESAMREAYNYNLKVRNIFNKLWEVKNHPYDYKDNYEEVFESVNKEFNEVC